MPRHDAHSLLTRALACMATLILGFIGMAQPVEQLLARSHAESTDEVERVRLWCVLLGDRYDDHTEVLSDPQVRTVLADTANNATLSWVLAASAYRSRGRLDSSRIMLDRAERSLRPDTDERVRAAVLLDQASILSVTGDQATATRKYYAVLPVLQRRGPAIDLGAAYIGLGFIFRYQRQFEEALTYYDRAAALAEPLGDSFTLSSALRGRAGILMEYDSIASAERLYRRALALAENPRVEAVLHTELANVHVLRREYTQALPDFKAALARFEADNNITWSSYLCARIAETLMLLDRTAEARSYGRKGLAIAEANGLRKEELDNLAILPKVCARLGRWDEALAYSKTFEAIDDSLRNDVVSTELAQLEVQLQEQRDSLARAEIEEKERMVYEAGMAQAKDERNLLLLLSCGVLLIVGGLWFRLRRIRRTRHDLAQGNAAIRKEKQRAERSERVKDQFLANMSHEIRTPMNAIVGMTATLKRGEHLPDQERYLNAIAQSSDNLLVILNDILDLGRLQDGDIVLDAVPFDPRKVVADVMEVMLFKAQEKKLRLEGRVDDTVPRSLIGDPARLNQVLLNLVGNGIKFTEAGGVTVGVSLNALDAGVAHLRFRIVDTGIGIAPERQEQIFEEFTQAYSDTTRKYGGTGLGLTISKRLVEMQNGTVSLQSGRGQGSTFILDIPYPATPGGTAAAEPVQEKGALVLEGLRILLAEDNEFNVMVARDELEDMIPGVRVDVAGNGQRAVQLMAEDDYDLVLMDIQMPEMNGYEATAAIRALGGHKGSTPIIAMTANVLESELERSLKAGMDGFVPKPFRRAELMECINRVLQNRR